MSRPLPLPDPPLCAGDVALRPWAPDDAPFLAAAWRDPEVARWTGVPERHDETGARRWIERTPQLRRSGLSLDLVVEVAGTTVGEVGVTGFEGAGPPEVGWWVAGPHRGRGCASRAVCLFVPWLVAEVAPVVIARCHPENPRSSAVARRAGFVELPGPEPDGTRVWVFEPTSAGGTVPV